MQSDKDRPPKSSRLWIDNQREVAIKLFFREAGKPLNELRVGRTLNHPSIIPTYEFLEEDGRSLIVMQYASKGNLRTRMHTGPMPLTDCLVILEDIAAGLAIAHDNNIIHRDVKPENIVFTADGKAKLTDFGHAWFLENTDSPNTLIGAGTPAYMAPEKESTARSDIYSLGVVVYEMLAGGLPDRRSCRQPFRGTFEERCCAASSATPHYDLRPCPTF